MNAKYRRMLRKLVPTIGTILSIFALVVLHHYFWWGIYVWLAVIIWASWRYVLRYMMPGSFVCSLCERPKCAKSLSARNSQSPVCTACEARATETADRIRGIHKNLDIIRDLVRLQARNSGRTQSIPRDTMSMYDEK